MRTLTIEGATVAHEDAGAGEPVVLLHGYPQSHLTWRHHIPILARTHRVIAIDWPGWGASDRLATLRYDYDTECSRLGLILDALGLDRCNLFAHDYGGYLALGYLARHSDR